MARLLSRARFYACLLWLWGALSTAAVAKVWTIAPSATMQYAVQEALIAADPGDIVELPEGRFAMTVELVLSKPFVTMRGQGMHKTELVYSETAAGPQGILTAADHTIIEDLAVIDHPGDGIKAVGVNGVTFRRVRVEWTKRAGKDNGAYGLYPVMSHNVLMEDNLVIGASDAGIYVGQSKNIVVRRNRVEYNVAGIEIENSQRADVYDNTATNNTGGILVFNLPNLLIKGGHGTRLFHNRIVKNNFVNFAPAGNSVALIPQGTGILIMANPNVEIFENLIADHYTTSIAVVSYNITERAADDPTYGAQPENIYIHNNTMKNAGRWPIIGANKLGLVAGALSFPHRIPHVVYDGIGPSDGSGGFRAAQLEGEQRLCLSANDSDGGRLSTFGNFNFWKQKKWTPIPGDLDRNIQEHDCELERLPPVSLDPTPALPPAELKESPARIAALCQAQGQGVNWAALAVDCPLLSDYRLFQDPTDPLSDWAEGALPYEPTTPLFSDYASKSRVIYMPPGTAATYQPQDTFALPVGTVIAKTFYFPERINEPEGPRRLVETRLLIHRASGWKGLEYVWDTATQTAKLTLGGAQTQVSWIDAKGKTQSNNYVIPNMAQCFACHLKGTPLGVRAGYLNREGIGPLKGHNQLQAMAEQGRLKQLPEDFTQVPRYPVWNDPTTGSLEARARTYLDINCAHCHRIEGKANTSALFLNMQHPLNINAGICKPPVAAGRGSGGVLLDIVPGKPDDSILMNRLRSNKAAIKMPEIAKTMVHAEGQELIAAWIKSLPGHCQE